MGTLIQLVMAIPKLLIGIIKIAIKTGFIWFAVPLACWGVYEAISGDMASLGGGFGNPVANVVFNAMWYLCYVLFPLTLIQNIIRVVKKEPKFSILRAVISIGHKKKVGFDAKIDGDNIAANTQEQLSGVVFGKLGNEYITKPETTDGHVIAFGGSGSAKTTGFAIPTLISWKYPVFVIDMFGELYEYTAAARPNPEKIKVFNPEDRSSCRYDPFFMLRKAKDRCSEAETISHAIIPLPSDVKEPIWIKGAQNLLTGFMLYYFDMGFDFSETMLSISDKSAKDLIDEIVTSSNADAKRYLKNYINLADETLGSFVAELETHTLPFATITDLQWALTGGGNCITPEDLENGYDVFCCIQQSRMKEWNDLMRMMCNQFLNFFEKRAADKTTPILFFIDEFPQLGKIESIRSGMGTLRHNKIHVALIVQSLADLDLHYGKDGAKTMPLQSHYESV